MINTLPSFVIADRVVFLISVRKLIYFRKNTRFHSKKRDKYRLFCDFWSGLIPVRIFIETIVINY